MHECGRRQEIEPAQTWHIAGPSEGDHRGGIAVPGRGGRRRGEAKANYDEVSARVLREVDRFRREYAVEMHATMVEFARMQKGRYDGMQEVWGTLLPRVEGMNASATTGCSFAREAAALREGGSTTMPTYPPPPEPVWNGARIGNATESLMLNGAIRYRDALPEE